MTKSELEQEVLGLRLELQDYSTLFDLQQKRMTEAVGLWRDATGHNYLPDLGCLLDWLMKRVAEINAMTQERDALRQEATVLARMASSASCLVCKATVFCDTQPFAKPCVETLLAWAKQAAQAGKDVTK